MFFTDSKKNSCSPIGYAAMHLRIDAKQSGENLATLFSLIFILVGTNRFL